MDLNLIFYQVAISLGLGLLVGIQRESAASQLAGIRTFALTTLFGTVSSLLAQTFGGWVIAAGALAMGALIFSGRTAEIREPAEDIGLTTEVAMMLMFAVGCYVVVGPKEIAIAIGALTAVLLQFKGQLHGIVRKLTPDDLKAIMQFALISLVILPALPNRTFGPFDVLNPRNIWFMVVLIVGISLGGYIIYKFFGQKAGIVLGGILGGMISSTATTISYSRDAKLAPTLSDAAVTVILISSATVYPRLLLEIATVAPGFLPKAIVPLTMMTIVLTALSAYAWFSGRHQFRAMPLHGNPSQMKPALVFALIYAVVLLIVAASMERLGSDSLYLVAGIAGLGEVDALTLSTARMVDGGRIAGDQGWRIVLTATLSNLAFKAGAVAVLGTRRMFARIAAAYATAIVIGIVMILLMK